MGSRMSKPSATPGEQTTSPYPSIVSFQNMGSRMSKPSATPGEQTTSLYPSIVSFQNIGSRMSKPSATPGEQTTSPYPSIVSFQNMGSRKSKPSAAPGEQTTLPYPSIVSFQNMGSRMSKPSATPGEPTTSPYPSNVSFQNSRHYQRRCFTMGSNQSILSRKQTEFLQSEHLWGLGNTQVPCEEYLSVSQNTPLVVSVDSGINSITDLQVAPQDYQVLHHDHGLCCSKAGSRFGYSEMDDMRSQLAKLTMDFMDLKAVVECSFAIANDSEKALAVLPVGARLDMPAVVRDCDATLRRGLNVRNCVRTFKLAQQMAGLEGLRKESQEFILLNFMQVWKETRDILDMCPADLKSLLFSDSLVIDQEEAVFEVMNQWVEADAPNRRDHFDSLAGALRLPCCQKDFLKQLLVHPLTEGSPFFRSRIRDILLLFESCPDRVHNLCQRLSRCVPADKEEPFIFALGGRTSPLFDEPSFETYDPIARKWKFRKDVADQPSGETVILPMGKEIFVLEQDSEKLRSFSPFTLQWRLRAPLPLHQRGASAAVIGNNIYVIGGYIQGRVNNRCFVYDYQCDRWSDLTGLRHPRTRSSSTAFRGKVYCSGGRDHKYITINGMESYDPIQDQWSEEPSMINSRWGHALVSCNEYIWAFGGCRITQALNEVERFDPLFGFWVSMPPMHTARRSLSVTIFQGQFYAIGGIDRNRAMGTTEVLDPERGTWIRTDDLCKARGALGTCVIMSGSRTWRAIRR